MKQALLSMTALLLVSIFASLASAAPDCGASEEGGGLLRCYQKEYSDKFKSNDQRSKDLTRKAKELLEEASEANAKKQTAAYIDFLHRLNQTVSSSRKTATASCVRMAARFESSSTSAVAAVNCRTGREVELDKDLRRLELQLEVLALQQP